MKKFSVTISDVAHLELLTIQLERKRKGQARTTLIQVASDVLNEVLEEKAKLRAKS
jgi:hypothetical protein